MARLTRAQLPAATVILLGLFPRHWQGGDFKGRHYAWDSWPNPLAQVLSMPYTLQRPACIVGNVL